MRHLPALIFGVLFLFILNFAFTISAQYSPILNYLTSITNTNANSSEYWLLGLHDSMIVLLISFIVVIVYKSLLPKLPFNLLTAALIQLPIIIFTLISSEKIIDFSSTYYSVTTAVDLISFVSIAFVFFALNAYNRRVKKYI